MPNCKNSKHIYYQVLFPDRLDCLLGVNDGRLDLVEVSHDLRLLVCDFDLLNLQQFLDLLGVRFLLLGFLLVFHLKQNKKIRKIRKQIFSMKPIFSGFLTSHLCQKLRILSGIKITFAVMFKLIILLTSTA